MILIHLLTEELRAQLKAPLGILLRGTFGQTLEEFKQITSRALQTYQDVSVDKFENCSSCEYKHYCCGGCRVLSIQSGSLVGKNPCCDVYKKTIEEVMWNLGKKIRETN